MRTLLLTKGPEARRWMLTALIAGVPVLFLRSGVAPFNVPKLALLSSGVVAVAALRAAEVLQGAPATALRRLAFPALAFAGPLVVSWIASPYKGWALFGYFDRFQGLIPYVLVVAIGVLAADAFAGRPQWVAWAMVAGGAVVAAYALLQVVGADPFRWDAFGAPTEGISTLGNSNFTGGFLSIVMPVAVGLAMLHHVNRRRAVRLLGVVVIGWLLARSEGGYAGGVAGIAVVAGFGLATRWRLARVAGVAVAAAVAVGVVTVGFIGAARPGTPLIPATVGLRGEWWMSALGMAADSPVVGRGPNSYALEGVSHRTRDDAAELTYDFADDPHSVPLSMLASAGILGAAGFIAVLVWAARRGFEIAPDDLLSAAFLGAVVAYFVQSLASIDELTLRVALWSSLAGLSVAVTAPRDAKRAKRSAPPASGRKKVRYRKDPLRAVSGVAALGVVVVAALWWSGGLVLADARAQRALSLYSSNEPEEAQRQLELALGFRNENYYSYLGGLEEAHLAASPESAGDERFAAAARAFGYLQGFPDVRGLVGYGRLLHQWAEEGGAGKDEEALVVYERALAIDPLNPVLRAEMGEVLVALEDYERAVELLEPAVELAGTGRYAQAWGTLGLARALLGDRAGAEEAIAVALALKADEEHALEAAEIIGPEATS